MPPPAGLVPCIEPTGLPTAGEATEVEPLVGPDSAAAPEIPPTRLPLEAPNVPPPALAPVTDPPEPTAFPTCGDEDAAGGVRGFPVPHNLSTPASGDAEAVAAVVRAEVD